MKLFEDVIVTPVVQNGENDFGGGVFDNTGTFIRECAHERSFVGHVHNNERLDIGRELSATKFPEGIYGGFAFNHFGHFLVESLGRVWAANEPAYRHLPIYFHPIWGSLATTDPKDYSSTVFKLAGIDVDRIRFITEVGRVERLIVPPQLYGFHHFDHPDPRMVEFLRGIQEAIECTTSDTAINADNIYVSRTLWAPAKGLIAGESEFETFLAEDGWTIFHPETASFLDQLLTYSKAKRILFSEGSAYHSVILLPQIRASIAIMFRRHRGWNQQRIEAQFRGFQKSLLSLQYVRSQICAGMPTWSGLSIVDFVAATNALVANGMLSSVFESWPNISNEIIDRDLKKFVCDIASDSRFIAFIKRCGADVL